MALRTEQKLPIILFVVFLTLSIIGVVFYQTTNSLQQALTWERQTNEYVADIEEVMTLCLGMEVGNRKFILTSNDSYLAPFERAKQTIPQNLARIKKYSEGDADANGEALRFEQLLKEMLAEEQRKVDTRKIEGPDSSTSLLTSPEDQPRMAQIRASMQRLETLAKNSLQAKESEIDNGLTRTVLTLIVSSIVGVLALGLANFVVYREITKRRSAEVALVDANRDLETRIEGRTAELKAMNERLIEIGGERELSLDNEKHARREAEIANRLRDEFMATVSHELRTPLNSILGWARLIKDGTLNASQTERAVATIIKNSETQNRLIEDLLDVARLISGKLELEREPVELKTVIREAIESAAPGAAAREISITLFESDPAFEPIIEGDNDRLHQVFANLLTNALKFSHDGGRIKIDLDRDDQMAAVRVADEGVGISPEFLPQVFERFRQDASGPDRNGGLGLGLAIVRNLVEMHDGSVMAESEGENKGAVFTVRLPLAAAKE